MSTVTEGPRVLYVVQAFGGGVFSVLRDVARLLVQQHGATLTIALAEGIDTPANYRDQFDRRITLVPMAMPTTRMSARNLAGLVTGSFEVARLIRSERPEVVHLHSSVAGVMGRFASRMTRGEVPHRLYYTPHGLSSLRAGDGAIKRLGYIAAESVSHAQGGQIVACSASERRAYAAAVWGGQRRNTSVVANGVPLPPLDTRPVARRVSPGRPVVTALGRLTRQKNPSAFARMARARPDACFVWIGDGEEGFRAELEAAGVRVTGWLPKDQVWTRLRETDVYVQYSGWEGLSVALLEAMMLGLPIIASNIPANRDAVDHGRTGFLVGSEADAAGTLATLLASEATRARIGACAREDAHRRFTIDRMAAELASLYAGS